MYCCFFFLPYSSSLYNSYYNYYCNLNKVIQHESGRDSTEKKSRRFCLKNRRSCLFLWTLDGENVFFKKDSFFHFLDKIVQKSGRNCPKTGTKLV